MLGLCECHSSGAYFRLENAITHLTKDKGQNICLMPLRSIRQGRSQDSVNGGAQLGAVTQPYNRQNVIVKGAEVLSPAFSTRAKSAS